MHRVQERTDKLPSLILCRFGFWVLLVARFDFEREFAVFAILPHSLHILGIMRECYHIVITMSMRYTVQYDYITPIFRTNIVFNMAFGNCVWNYSA